MLLLLFFVDLEVTRAARSGVKDISSTVFVSNKIFVYFTLYMFILQHFRGRKNRCYSLAVRAVRRAFVYATKARRLKKRNMRTVRYSIKFTGDVRVG